jgi:hypothetical protein
VTDSGTFYYWVTAYTATNESPGSTPLRVSATDTSTSRFAPHWLNDSIVVSLAEGDTFSFHPADSCLDTNQASVLSFAVAGTATKGRLAGDTLYSFAAGRRDSGYYHESLVAIDGQLTDTLVVALHVQARYCSLSTTASNGRISVSPNQTLFRWADSVTLTAAADSGYEFSSWTGSVSGTSSTVSIVMDHHKTVTALFTGSAGCTVLTPGESINRKIAELSPSAKRPAVLCPQPGLYESNTVKIDGVVKISIQ